MKKIFFAGDSICYHYDITRYPQAGIVQGLALYIKQEFKVFNHAIGGRSTKSYIDEGRLDAIAEEIETGDFLFIKFGHNDEKKEDPERYTDPFGSYKDNLKKYIDVARKVGAIPILVTPLERRNFLDAWKLGPSAHADYVAGMKEVASEEGVALIDLYTKSRNLMEEAGSVETTKWFMHIEKGKYPPYLEGIVDNTHINHTGAVIFAGAIAEGLQELGGVYAELLVDGIGVVVEKKRN